MDTKVCWAGEVLGIQPRIRLIRSFDERSHQYLGYNLYLHGSFSGQDSRFTVAIGKETQDKHALHAGDTVSGSGVRVADPRKETAEIYKVSELEILTRGKNTPGTLAPYVGVPPSLEVYRARGHRRLSARTYATKCRSCLWGAGMAVEIIVDHWNPAVRRYRSETFCYGPKSCPLYTAGPTRKVPGRSGMSWEEEDWVDEETTAHRGPNE